MSRKTTTTTVVRSTKDSNGDWQENTRVVTTVVERDDDGYPYTVPRFTPKPYLGGQIGYYGGLDGFHIQPVRKNDQGNNEQGI